MSPNTVNNSSSVTAKQIYQAARGNQEALAQLYELSYSQVYSSVKALIWEQTAVKVLIRDSYLQAFQNLDQLEQPEDFCGWMKAVAISNAKFYIRQNDPELLTDCREDGEEAFQPAKLQEMPEEMPGTREIAGLLEEIFSEVGKRQRMAVTLYGYDGRTTEEIGEILECSRENAEHLLGKAQQSIVQKLQQMEQQGLNLQGLTGWQYVLCLMQADVQAAAPSIGILKNILTQSMENPTIRIQPDESSRKQPDETADLPEETPDFPQENTEPAVEKQMPQKAKAEKKQKQPRKKTGLKILAAVLAAVIVVGGIAAAVLLLGNQKTEAQAPAQTQQTEAVMPTETEAEEVPVTEPVAQEPSQMVITPTGMADLQDFDLPEQETVAAESVPEQTEEKEAAEPEQTEKGTEASEAAPEKAVDQEVALAEKSDTPEGQIEAMLGYLRRLMELDAQSVLDGKYSDLPHIDSLYLYYKSQIKTGVTMEEAVFAEDADFDCQISYCTPDLDGDGRPELVLASSVDYGDGYEDPTVEQVFCFDGSKRMAGVFLGRGYLLQDGTLWGVPGNAGTIEYVLEMQSSQPKPRPADQSEMGQIYSKEAVDAHGGLFTSDSWQTLS